ncbi:MAG: hypothetical protein PWR20_1976 [Bacteroidales bacterium]|jgi:8-oxo-dGTP pyrophosphatase MutT (NUDIX family)|nr:hypothetical protein [Bacteroidales bacterium]MDN5330495.1 hypothetical protein [Bacteroidales bacterium]
MKISSEEDLFSAFINRLEKRLAEPLPGASAWQRLMPRGRVLEISADVVPQESAVLVLFLKIQHSLDLLFIRRSQDGRIHGGQMGFPGGRAEPSDQNLANTALREAAEETGIKPSTITLVGKLTPLYIPHSNFRVHPYVGYTMYPQAFRRQEQEIDEIVLIPYSRFFSTDCLVYETFVTLRGKVEAPCFKIDDIGIWGATAMILSELISTAPSIDLNQNEPSVIKFK